MSTSGILRLNRAVCGLAKCYTGHIHARQFHLTTKATIRLSCANNIVYSQKFYSSEAGDNGRHDRKPVHHAKVLHRRSLDKAAVNLQMEALRASVAELSESDRFGSFDDKHQHTVESDKYVEKRQSTLEADDRTRKSAPESDRHFDSLAYKNKFAAYGETPTQRLDENSRKFHGRNARFPLAGDDLSNELVSVRSGSLNDDGQLSNEHHTVRRRNDGSGKMQAMKARSTSSPTDDDWSQKYGTLSDDVDKFLSQFSDKRYADDEGEDDESEKPYVRLSDENRKHKPFYYGNRISKLGKAGKVYESMEVLEKQMLKEDRVLPNQFVFTVLIGVLGRVGYTKKAFQLFNKMKKFGLAPEDPTYTALFNACSNSPWPVDGIQRADRLRQLMSEKDYTPNMLTYNSMIKAYAVCGDVQKAFGVVDEAIAAGNKPRASCFCFILMACIADKETGMKLAIEVWRLMRQKRLKPSILHYNLLLRAVRDCGLGDSTCARQLLAPPANQLLEKPSQGVHQTSPDKAIRILTAKESGVNAEILKVSNVQAYSHTSQLVSTARSVIDRTDAVDHVDTSAQNQPSTGGYSIFDATGLPDLLDPYNRPTGVVGFEIPKTADGRLALLGGLPGILGQMQKDKAKPDIKTFSLLLEVVPSTPVAEADLMAAMALHGVQPDIDFFSMLIRKRNLRRDFFGAHQVLELIRESALKPNIRTFGCLAMGCPTLSGARQLLSEIKAADMLPNIEICEILVFQSHLDFNYKLAILKMMKSFEIRPNNKVIEKLESSISYARKKIVQKEHGEPVSAYYGSDQFAEGFRRFTMHYRSWLLSMKLEPKEHPWDRFRQPTPSLDKMNVTDDFPSDDEHATSVYKYGAKV